MNETRSNAKTATRRSEPETPAGCACLARPRSIATSALRLSQKKPSTRRSGESAMPDASIPRDQSSQRETAAGYVVYRDKLPGEEGRWRWIER